jgi:predicted GNAT family N-acyltransferase
MISIKRIHIQDPLYQLERELRNKILLRPIGVPDYGWEKNDWKSWHFVAVENNDVIGCVVLVPLDGKKKKTQLIQMAVDISRQGNGIGKKLIEELLNFCESQSIAEIEIHAREDVVSFYEKYGFEVFGEPFEEVGIRHRYMRKSSQCE